MTCTQTTIKLWANKTDAIETWNYSDVCLVTNAKVNKWQGKTSLTSTGFTQIMLDPEIAEAAELQQW